MQPLFDDFDDFESFDFADSAVVRRMLQEQIRDEVRYSMRRSHGPDRRRQLGELDDDEGLDGIDDYADYNADEFDRYAGLDFDN